MANYNYYQPGASLSGCPGTAISGGWYAEGSSTPIATDYRNPVTGMAYTPQELAGVSGGATTPTAGTTTPATTPVAGTTGEAGFNAAEYEANLINTEFGGVNPHIGSPNINDVTPTTPGITPGTTTPTFGEGAAAGIPAPTVDAAPPYEISPEQQEMQDLYGDKLTDWVEAGGYGLSPEVQAQMIQLQTDTLKANEAENIRVMTNNMERRGITNSGYLAANTNMIHANTTKALASAISNVQIQSALMKMESFEHGMASMNNFLGYLSEQSQLQYAPEFATWQAEQAAKLQGWQAQIDIYKLELNQAYQTQNTYLQAELESKLNTQQHQFNIELAEMEIEANQQAATASGIGSILGTVLGFVFGS